MALRLVFMGTPEFSVKTLDAIVKAGHEIVACYTQPPRPAGRRGLELKKSPVHIAADNYGIEVRTPESLRSTKEHNEFSELNADAAIVVAYGLLLPNEILEAPRLGCFNGHASSLPRWRGAAPIQRAIMAGDKSTAMMIMKMEEGLDTGPIIMSRSLTIDDDMTAGVLHDKLAETGAALMVEALSQVELGDHTMTDQSPHGVTYAKKIEKQESRIDWSASAEVCHKHIMGLSPFPGAWCEMTIAGKEARVKILRSSPVQAEGVSGTVLSDELVIACGSGAIQLLELQKAGSKAMSASEFLRGNNILAGDVLN